MPLRKPGKTSTLSGRKPVKRTAATGRNAATLPESMVTGKASPAKEADGNRPVFAYIASLPQPQRGIAERVDALATRTLPGLQRSVKWGMAYYGVGDGQGYAGSGTQVRGRPRRTSDRGMDEADRSVAGCRGHEAIGPRSVATAAVTSERVSELSSDADLSNAVGHAVHSALGFGETERVRTQP